MVTWRYVVLGSLLGWACLADDVGSFGLLCGSFVFVLEIRLILLWAVDVFVAWILWDSIFDLRRVADPGTNFSYGRSFSHPRGPCNCHQPERIKPPAAGGGYSVQADVWSLGVMIVELITGNHPYDLEARAKERAEEGMSPIVGEAETPRPEQVDRLDPNELLAIPGRSETMSSFGSGSGASEAYESYGSSGGEGSLSEIPSAVLSSGSPRMTPATAPAILQNRPELTFLDLSADSPDSADRMARRPSTQRAGSLDAARDGMPSPPRPLVEQASVFDLLDAIVNGPVPSIPDTVDVSIELRSFLARCLDKDPSKRGKPGELARHPWLAGAEGKVPADCLAILLEEKKRKEAEE